MKIDWKSCLKVAAIILGLYLIIFYWEAISGFIQIIVGAAIPLLIGCVIAYIVNIPMSFYQRHYFPKSQAKIVTASRRPVCLILAYLSIAAIIIFVMTLVLPELINSVQILAKDIPPTIERIVGNLQKNEYLTEIIPEEYSTDFLGSINIQDILGKFFTIVGGSIGSVFNVLGAAFSTVTSFALSLIISIYILSSKEKLKRHFSQLLNTYIKPSLNSKILYLLSTLDKTFHKFIVGQCTEAVILGVLCCIGMTIFNFPYAIMTGVFIGFMALIPFAGAYIGAIVGAFMIMTVSVSQVFWFILFIIILQQLEDNLIYPRVVGTSIGLPGIWVLCVITIGGALMGILGMLIAVPLAATAYQLLKNDIKSKQKNNYTR